MKKILAVLLLVMMVCSTIAFAITDPFLETGLETMKMYYDKVESGEKLSESDVLYYVSSVKLFMVFNDMSAISDYSLLHLKDITATTLETDNLIIQCLLEDQLAYLNGELTIEELLNKTHTTASSMVDVYGKLLSK